MPDVDIDLIDIAPQYSAEDGEGASLTLLETTPTYTTEVLEGFVQLVDPAPTYTVMVLDGACVEMLDELSLLIPGNGPGLNTEVLIILNII